MLRFHTALFAVCVLAYPAVGRADGDELTDLLVKGFELRQQHRNEEALEVYERAVALSPAPRARAQRGLAEQALGHWSKAESDLARALSTDEDEWVTRNRLSLERALGVVRGHLAWLTVEVDVDGAEVQLDGEPLHPGVEARVVAGAGVLEVRAPGHVPDIRRVAMAPSEHVHQSVKLAPLVPAAPPTSAAPPPLGPPSNPPQAAPVVEPPQTPKRGDAASIETPRQGSSIGPIALGAVGVAAVATGAYFGARAVQDKSNERAHCVAGCTSTAVGDYWDAQTSATVSTIALTGGVALAAGGVVWWFLDRGKHRSRDGEGIRVVPALSGGIGLTIGGRL